MASAEYSDLARGMGRDFLGHNSSDEPGGLNEIPGLNVAHPTSAGKQGSEHDHDLRARSESRRQESAWSSGLT